jgi:His/Glu/Gln/Arg/opine family amino acid ABC transporter permease subunit
MSQHLRRAAFSLLLLLLSFTPTLAQTALERVRSSGELRIGTDATYPPFENKEDGEFKGFDIDLGNAIAKEMGVRAVFINSNFQGIFPALQNGSFDVVISALTITPERSKTLLFTDPYYDAGQVVAIRNDRKDITGVDDLRGKRAGVQLNTTGQFELEKRGGVEVSKFDTMDLAMLALQNGQIDAVVGDAPTVRYMIRQSFRSLKTIGPQFTDEKYGIVLTPGSEDLRDEINKALKSLRASKYNQLYDKWFGEEAEKAAEQQAAQKQPKAFDLGLLRHAWPVFLSGVWLTARLALLSLFLGLPIGLLLALARVQSLRLLSAPAAIYVEVMRGTPLLVQIIFIHYGIPQAFGLSSPDPFISGVIALTLNSAAYISEIIRAGILSIDAGQMEAARSLGMGHWQAMRRIILPQTFRRVVPPLTNEGIALLKDSSLVSVLALEELTRVGNQLVGVYAAPLTIWPMVALLYLLLTFPLTRVAEYLERRWKPVTRS